MPTHDPAGRSAAIDWLKQECGLDDAGAAQAVDYIAMGRAALGVVPSQNVIVAERFFDESGGMQLVIHAPFGSRINKAWGLALRKRFCRSFNFELQAAATDNGLNISLGEQHSFPLGDVFHYLQAASVKEVLEQAVLAAPLFTVRWRCAAGRSLACCASKAARKSRRRFSACAGGFTGCGISEGYRLPGEHRRRYRDSRSRAGAGDDERRAYRGAGPGGPTARFGRYRGGRIRCLAVDSATPSVFSHEILNAIPMPISTTPRSKSGAPGP